MFVGLHIGFRSLRATAITCYFEDWGLYFHVGKEALIFHDGANVLTEATDTVHFNAARTETEAMGIGQVVWILCR